MLRRSACRQYFTLARHICAFLHPVFLNHGSAGVDFLARRVGVLNMRKQSFLRIMASATFMAWLSVSAAGAAVFVRLAPPRPLVERVVVRPSPGYAWLGGYYRWTGRSYVWVAGRWALPPRPGVVWVPPHWNYVRARGSYVFVAGFWR
jgi:hypothetical protein